jgi:hypothetical protein
MRQVYLLAVVIAGFSGAWPYVKLALLAACWTTPTRRMPLRWRQQLLLWLEALGKWSLIDTFVLVMMMVAFKFHLALSKVSEIGWLSTEGLMFDMNPSPDTECLQTPSQGVVTRVVTCLPELSHLRLTRH